MKFKNSNISSDTERLGGQFKMMESEIMCFEIPGKTFWVDVTTKD